MLRINPALRRCWRDVGRLQLGADPAHAHVLDDLSAGDEALLEDLVGGVAEADLAVRAAARGVPAEAATHLVALLGAAGALEPPSAPGARAAARATAAEARAQSLVHATGGWDVLARRARHRVVVEGRGRAPDAVAAGLEEAGLGDVDLRAPGGAGHDPADLPHRPTGRVRRPPAARSAPMGRGGLRAGAGAGSDLVVLVCDGAAPPARAAALLRADTQHLAVVLRERSAVVGPLVVPGRSPCLRCLDLHRTDRDPEWPVVVAQLAHPGREGAPPDVVLLRLTAALVVAQVVAHLDGLAVPAAPRGGPDPGREPAPGRCGRPSSPPRTHRAAHRLGQQPPVPAGGAAGLGRTWEVALPDGLPVGREWSPHPACGCTWPPR